MTQPITRGAYLRDAEEAERLGNFAVAGTLKGLALAARTLETPAELPDLDALKTRIAEAEDAGDWPRSGALKSQLLDARRAPRK